MSDDLIFSGNVPGGEADGFFGPAEMILETDNSKKVPAEFERISPVL